MKNKNLFNKIVDSKIFWMLLSLLIAFFLWSYVAAQDTQEINKTFRGVPVVLLGEDAMRDSRQMVITDLDANSVNITVVGPRRVLSDMKASDLVAQVDVSKLTQSGSSSLTYTVIFPDGTDTHSLQITNRAPMTVSFNVSALIKKQIDVHGRFAGHIADDYLREDPVFEPSTITVYGAEIYLKDVKDAWVVFGENTDISQSYTVEASFILRDKNDEECSTANLSFSDDVIVARQPLSRVKKVNLDVSVIYGAGASDENTKVTIEPDSIQLSGDSEVLDAINLIKLGTVDTTDFSASKEYVFPIRYADGLTNQTGTTEARVKVEIVNLSTKNFGVDNIVCLNTPDGFESEIITQTIAVTLRGPADQLSQVSKENIWAEADLTDYGSAGSFLVPVKIRVDGFPEVGNIGIEAPKVLIELKKAEE